MSQKHVFKGVFLIGLAAAGYGMLATIVKLAYDENYTAVEVTLSQYIYGLTGMLIIYLFERRKKKEERTKTSGKEKTQLIAAGTTLGFTATFYYISAQFVPASIAIVLLMQAIWMSMVIEMFVEKKWPSRTKIFAVLIILAGTVLATNLIADEITIDWRGAIFGLLAAASFATTMYASNQIATNSPSVERTLYMLIGATLMVLAFTIWENPSSFNFGIFASWAIPLALFGAIFPPLLMNAGFPHTGISLGSIIASLELPVAVTVAYFVLNERVVFTQWLGIGLILFAILMINLKTDE